jgi:hypothetical protein
VRLDQGAEACVWQMIGQACLRDALGGKNMENQARKNSPKIHRPDHVSSHGSIFSCQKGRICP